jgi:hypothetical protein
MTYSYWNSFLNKITAHEHIICLIPKVTLPCTQLIKLCLLSCWLSATKPPLPSAVIVYKWHGDITLHTTHIQKSFHNISTMSSILDAYSSRLSQNNRFLTKITPTLSVSLRFNVTICRYLHFWLLNMDLSITGFYLGQELGWTWPRDTTSRRAFYQGHLPIKETGGFSYCSLILFGGIARCNWWFSD